MAIRPFPVNAELTAVAALYRNPDVALIADDVLPRTPASASFKYLNWDLAQGYSVPDLKVGRKSYPNEVEFRGTEIADTVLDYAIDDFVPNQDIDDDNQGLDPLGAATTYLTGLLRLGREVRAANLVFAQATYPLGNRTALSGTSQWSDYTNSDPVTAILNALDIPVMRPNVAVFGQRVWTRLRNHPRVVSAVFGSNQSGQLVTRQMMAEVLEVQAVYVGAGFVNTAKPGQTASLARVWGNHAAFMYRDRAAGPQAGTTFGFTAERTGVMVGLISDDKRGISGGQTVRVMERVKEVVSANALGYYFENAVA
jgi:hypothetical protein